MQYAVYTFNQFDTTEIKQILTDASYRTIAEADYKDSVNEILNNKLEYELDEAPYFCNPNVYEIYNMMLRMNYYNLFFYSAMFSGDYDKTMLRYNNIQVLLGNIIDAIQADPQLNDMFNAAIKQ
jgi:hypothetical protein